MSAGDEMWFQGAAASYVKIGLFPECLTLFGLLKQPRSLQMTHLPPGALPAGDGGAAVTDLRDASGRGRRRPRAAW